MNPKLISVENSDPNQVPQNENSRFSKVNTQSQPNISAFPWFFPNISRYEILMNVQVLNFSRKDAEEILAQVGPKHFLLRESSVPNSTALSFVDPPLNFSHTLIVRSKEEYSLTNLMKDENGWFKFQDGVELFSTLDELTRTSQQLQNYLPVDKTKLSRLNPSMSNDSFVRVFIPGTAYLLAHFNLCRDHSYSFCSTRS